MFVNFGNYNNISFQRKKKSVEALKPKRISKSGPTEYKDLYITTLAAPLKSFQNTNFEKKLQAVADIHDFSKAKARIANLSRYLKENMVGFVVPEYQVKGEKKGGYQWFEKSAEYLLRGCKQGAKEEDFKSIAKELYGLLALHDNYWKSDDFINYLSSLTQTPALIDTIQAIKELQGKKSVSFSSTNPSILKHISRLLKDGGAYSTKPLIYCSGATGDRLASVDHIMPEDWGGPCEDYNYILSSAKINSTRGNISLLDFLKGHDAYD